MDRYDPYTDKFLRDTQYDILGTNLASLGTDLISRQQAIDEIGEWIKAFRENGHKESAADACLIQDGIIQLPPAQPEIIPCDYVKACNEATNYKMISAASYLEVLEELKKHGYVLVDTIKER